MSPQRATLLGTTRAAGPCSKGTRNPSTLRGGVHQEANPSPVSHTSGPASLAACTSIAETPARISSDWRVVDESPASARPRVPGCRGFARSWGSFERRDGGRRSEHQRADHSRSSGSSSSSLSRVDRRGDVSTSGVGRDHSAADGTGHSRASPSWNWLKRHRRCRAYTLRHVETSPHRVRAAASILAMSAGQK
jgi:hypothetical protein